MSWLSNTVRAIGQVLGTTPAVMHVRQIILSLIGGNSNTVEQSPQHVSPELKRKRSSAKAVTQAQLRKAETSRAQTRTKKSSTSGTQQATPARQPARKLTKSKSSVAQSTTAVKSRKAEPKPAQTTSGKRGRPRKTPV